MKWRVYGTVVGSTYLGDVEADTEEEAIEIMSKKSYVSFCHQCAHNCEDPQVENVTAEEYE
jgi:hypothetical protein